MLKEFANPNMAFSLAQEPIRTRPEADEDEDDDEDEDANGDDKKKTGSTRNK